MIVGGPGAGKTRLARIMGDRLGLPVFSVDEFVWDKDGKVRSNAEIDAAMQELAARDRWIIEGGNTRTYAERERRADLVICLRPPVWLRLCRVLRRRGVSIDLLRWTIRYDAVFGRLDRRLAEGREGKRAEFRSKIDLQRYIDRL